MRNKICIAVLLITSVIAADARDQDPGQWLGQPLPDRWETSAETGTETALPGGEWWHSFEDATLDTLIAMGLDRNYDLRIAMNRIEAARHAVGEAASAYYPTIGLNAGYTRSRTPGAAQGRNIPSTDAGSFALGASMSWEIDVFGRITEQVRQKKTMANISRYDYEGARLTIAAEIATQYINLIQCRAQLAIAREHLASQKRVMEISTARYEAGLVSKLDVAQAKTVYYSTEATVPTLEARCTSALNALAILVAAYPDDITPMLGRAAKLPPYIQLISTGVPADLLRRRPDIITAEQEIEANASAVGIARKEYLPSLRIEGSVGTASHNVSGLFGKNSLQYEIAPTLTWTLFEGFYRKHLLADAKLQMQTAIEQYNYTVMNAVMETDNAMAAYSAAVQSIEFNNRALQQSDEAFQLSINQYKEGLTSFTDVMNAQLSWLEYANADIEAQATALLDLIQIYRALGGTINP